MNKLYIVILSGLILAMSNSAQAQCTPDPNNTVNGVTPDPLPAACAAEAYDQTIQLRFKKDSTITYEVSPGFSLTGTAYAKKLEILSFNGLPNGVDYECETSNCVKDIVPEAGYENTCLSLNGTPSSAETGTASLEVKITLYIQQANLDTTYTTTFDVDYQILDEGSCVATSLDEIAESKFSIAPNPVTASSKIDVSLASAGNAVLKIYDVLGSEIANESLGNLTTGTHTVSSEQLSNLSSGMYIVKLFVDGSETAQMQRIIVE